MKKLIFSVCVIAVSAAAAICASAQTFTTLVTFDGANGETPYFAPLVEDTNGNIYGTTQSGGTASSNCSNGQGFGCGTIYEISPEGEFSTLYTFCSQSICTDGNTPFGGLTHDGAGNLYGTTYLGGSTYGGTVFKITPAGALTTIYTFCSQTNCADGAYPYAGLLWLDGVLYGTTSSGGAGNAGTIFKVTPAGQYTTLYSFCTQANCSDGEGVWDRLIAANGNLYGTTQEGGANGFGTVFSVTTAGTFTTLHSFDSADGATPIGALVHAANGYFYGTTSGGGARDDGTVFKITSTGKLTTIYNFCAKTDCPDGVGPVAGLTQSGTGNFYGTTTGGGAHFYGTAFEITPGGKLTTLYSFCSETGCADGENPYAPLLKTTTGTLYGTTFVGGDLSCDNPTGCGTVFSLTP